MSLLVKERSRWVGACDLRFTSEYVNDNRQQWQENLFLLKYKANIMGLTTKYQFLYLHLLTEGLKGGGYHALKYKLYNYMQPLYYTTQYCWHQCDYSVKTNKETSQTVW